MKIKRKKYIALLTLISMLVVTCIPLESFALNDSEPEVLIVVEEMDPEEEIETELLPEEEKADAPDESESEPTVVEEQSEEQDEAESELPAEIESTNTQYSDDFQELMPIKALTSTVFHDDEVDDVEYAAINELLGSTYDGTATTEPDKWYSGSNLTIDEHFIFGEDRMYTEGKANRGFDNLLDNNTSTPFYVTTNDTGVNYQDLTGKEISVTFHTNSPVVIDHFKIISGGDTYKADYAHRSPAAWNLKAGNSLDSCNTVLLENLPVKATAAYEENIYEFENTTPYKYYKFTVTALVGAGRSGHDSPFSNPTATCLLADIVIGGPEEAHVHNDGIKLAPWDSTSSLPNTNGNYYLTSDVEISSTWNVPSGETTLCLNGHKIDYTGSTGSVITVNGGAVLNLNDCDTTTRYYYINSDYLGVVVDTRAAAEAGNPDRNGSFTGGYITGGKGAWTDNDYRGGAMFVNGGTVNLYGGTLIGNKPKANVGGIYCRMGTVTLHDGASIIGNTTKGEGGGIVIQGQGNLIMDGGLIADNTVVNEHGGGIAVVGKATITGGKITRNLVTGGSNGGGGISSLAAPENLIIGGDVEITDNRADGYGGGIFAVGWGWMNGAVSITGSPKITGNEAKHGGDSFVTDNLYLTTENNSYYTSGQELTVIGALTENAEIGVTMQSGTGVFTSGLSGKGTAQNFKSDNSEFAVKLNADGEACIAVDDEHTHDDIKFTKWTATDSLPTAAGNYCLAGDVTISSTWNVPQGTTNLCLNGHGIIRTGAEGTTGSAIQVSSGATLDLYDCGTETRYYTVANPSANGAGLGTLVEESVYNAAGENERGTFTGGYITGG